MQLSLVSCYGLQNFAHHNSIRKSDKTLIMDTYFRQLCILKMFFQLGNKLPWRKMAFLITNVRQGFHAVHFGIDKSERSFHLFQAIILVSPWRCVRHDHFPSN